MHALRASLKDGVSSARRSGSRRVAVQKQLGVDQPDFGVLFDDMELLNGGSVPMARLMQPKVEAEVAFVVGRDVDSARPPSWSGVPAIDRLCAARDRDRRQRDRRLEDPARGHDRRQRVVGAIRARRPAGLPGERYPRGCGHAARVQRRGRLDRDREPRASIIRCEPRIGWPARWRSVAPGCAPARSSCRARSAPWSR